MKLRDTASILNEEKLSTGDMTMDGSDLRGVSMDRWAMDT